MQSCIPVRCWNYCKKGRICFAVCPQPLEMLTDGYSYSCDELLCATRESILAISNWLGTVLNGSFDFWVPESKMRVEREGNLDNLRRVRDRLSMELELFRKEKKYVTSVAGLIVLNIALA